VAREHRLHTRALDAHPPPVDQPDLGEAARVGLAQVVVDDGGDVGGREGVEVERVLDRERDRRVRVGRVGRLGGRRAQLRGSARP
jgi:hypothetical protein